MGPFQDRKHLSDLDDWRIHIGLTATWHLGCQDFLPSVKKSCKYADYYALQGTLSNSDQTTCKRVICDRAAQCGNMNEALAK